MAYSNISINQNLKNYEREFSYIQAIFIFHFFIFILHISIVKIGNL